MTSPLKKVAPKLTGAEGGAGNTAEGEGGSVVEDVTAPVRRTSREGLVKVKALIDGLSVGGKILRTGEEAQIARSKTLDLDGNSWLDMNQQERFGQNAFEIVK